MLAVCPVLGLEELDGPFGHVPMSIVWLRNPIYRMRMHAVEESEGCSVLEDALVFHVGADLVNGRENVCLDASEGGGSPSIGDHVHAFVYDTALKLLYKKCQGLT